MNSALISLGANTPDKEHRLTNAINAIERIATITARSPIYHSEAEGHKKSAPYANALLQIATNTDFDTLHDTFKLWERQAGRTPQSKLQGEIPLDIDIVVWNDNILRQSDLQYDFMQQGMKLMR